MCVRACSDDIHILLRLRRERDGVVLHPRASTEVSQDNHTHVPLHCLRHRGAFTKHSGKHYAARFV